MGFDPRRGADHDGRAWHTRALVVRARRRERNGTDSSAETKILRQLEVPHRSLKGPRSAQHPVRGIVDQYDRIARLQRGVFHLSFAFFKFAAEISRKMLADDRVVEHTGIATDIALCGAFKDLPLAQASAVPVHVL